MATSTDPQAGQAADGVAISNGDSLAQLRDLTAQATLKYSLKDYSAAAELYSQATELQAEINGEMSSENADLLYAYGRCLYHVAVKNSDVLGSKMPTDKTQEAQSNLGGAKQEKQMKAKEDAGQETRIAEAGANGAVDTEKGTATSAKDDGAEGKPYFQFTGDENWDTSDEEGDGAADGEGDEDGDENDDFANAYEMLDLARVLLLKKLQETGNIKHGDNEAAPLQEVQHLKERLADTYDLQAEISLEGEKFADAVVDLKSALELKQALLPLESSLLAEAHYKLSLALEFSSVTQQKNDAGEVEPGTVAHVDKGLREEAVQEMKAAIASCKRRIQKEETKLGSASENDKDTRTPTETQNDIDEVKELVSEMEQRLVELQQPPVLTSDPINTSTFDGSNPLNGILKSIIGESSEAQTALLEEVSKGATDLTNLVKRKRVDKDQESEAAAVDKSVQSNGKRKADFAEEDVLEAGVGKKTKVSKDENT